MKKIALPIVALIIAAACAAPSTNRQGAETTSVATPSPVVAMTEADAIAKEKAIWESIKVKDYDAFAAMLDSDQLEVLPDGVMDKAGSIAGVKQFEPEEVNFSDWKYLSIDKDLVLVTYTVAVKGKYQGKPFPLESARASSAWRHRDGKWLAIYHQECPMKPPMPPPAAKPSPKIAASPSTSPAAPPVPGSDPVANEKMVWGLFKAKNYDAFAELLAPNFLEVEPDAVVDRAGTIAGVQMFDASKAELSDFQTINIDADAAIVIYTVKNPIPMFAREGERHTTIWVRRDGKWMGQFHHGGTPVRKPSPTPAASASPTAKASVSPAAKASPSPSATR